MGLINSSFDFPECYPPIGHAPYWTILFGFMTSTLLTYVTYSSGRGLVSLLKSCMSCKCCSNKKIDFTKTNNWEEYPKIINICSANPFKKNVHAEKIYGDYLLRRESSHYYESAVENKYCLQYVNQQSSPYYNGWVLTTETERKFRYEMAQRNDLISNDSGFELNAQTPEMKEKPLLINEADANSNTHSTINTNEALAMLSRRRQIFTVFTANELDLGSKFYVENVYHSNFIEFEHYTEFNTENHWIDFKGFHIYKHNVLKHPLFDINGKYVLKNVDKSVHGTISFEFEHQHHSYLGCRVDVNTMNKSQSIRIYHGSFRQVAWIYLYEDEHSAKQYDFDGEVEIILKFTGKSASDRRLARFIEWLFVLMGGYQLVIDIIYFVHYTKHNVSAWQKYECYCYILTNSTNMKQLFVFVLCWIISGNNSFFDRKMSGINVMKVLFWLLYLFLVIPTVATHIIPFVVAYCWILLVVACFMCIAFCCCMYQYQYEGTGGLNMCAIVISLISALMIYFSLVLWPVACMSRLYDGDEYIDALYSVFADRHTTDYIHHFVDSYHQGTQFILWVL